MGTRMCTAVSSLIYRNNGIFPHQISLGECCTKHFLHKRKCSDTQTNPVVWSLLQIQNECKNNSKNLKSWRHKKRQKTCWKKKCWTVDAVFVPRKGKWPGRGELLEKVARIRAWEPQGHNHAPRPSWLNVNKSLWMCVKMGACEHIYVFFELRVLSVPAVSPSKGVPLHGSGTGGKTVPPVLWPGGSCWRPPARPLLQTACPLNGSSWTEYCGIQRPSRSFQQSCTVLWGLCSHTLVHCNPPRIASCLKEIKQRFLETFYNVYGLLLYVLAGVLLMISGENCMNVIAG